MQSKAIKDLESKIKEIEKEVAELDEAVHSDETDPEDLETFQDAWEGAKDALSDAKKELVAAEVSAKPDNKPTTGTTTVKKPTTKKPTTRTQTAGRKPKVSWKKSVSLEKLKELAENEEVKLGYYIHPVAVIKTKKMTTVDSVMGEKTVATGQFITFLMEDDGFLQHNVHNVSSVPKVLRLEPYSGKKMEKEQVDGEIDGTKQEMKKMDTPGEKSTEISSKPTADKNKPKSKRKSKTPESSTAKGMAKEVKEMDKQEQVEESESLVLKTLDLLNPFSISEDKKEQEVVKKVKRKKRKKVVNAVKNADTTEECQMIADAASNAQKVVEKIKIGSLKDVSQIQKELDTAFKPLDGVKTTTEKKAKGAAKSAKVAMKKADIKRKSDTKKSAPDKDKVKAESAISTSTTKSKTKEIGADKGYELLVELERKGNWKKTVSASKEIELQVKMYLAGELTSEEFDELQDITFRFRRLSKVSKHFKKYGKELPAYLYMIVETYLQKESVKERIERVLVLNNMPVVIVELLHNKKRTGKVRSVGFNFNTGEEVVASDLTTGSYKVIAVWSETEAKNKGKIALSPLYDTNLDKKSRCDKLTETSRAAYECIGGQCSPEEKKDVFFLESMCGDIKGEKEARCYQNDFRKAALIRFNELKNAGENPSYPVVAAEVRKELEQQGK